MLYLLEGRLPIQMIGNCSACLGDVSLLSHVCIHWFIHSFISIWTYKHLFHTLDFNPMLSYLFCYLSYSSFGLWDLFQLALLSLWHTPSIAVVSSFSLIISVIIRCSKLILHSSCLIPRISHFSKECWFLLSDNGVRNQGLNARCAQCYLSVTASSPVYTNVRVCVHARAWTCICVSAYIYDYFYMRQSVSIFS